jgi:hypothetical protein
MRPGGLGFWLAFSAAFCGRVVSSVGHAGSGSLLWISLTRLDLAGLATRLCCSVLCAACSVLCAVCCRARCSLAARTPLAGPCRGAQEVRVRFGFRLTVVEHTSIFSITSHSGELGTTPPRSLVSCFLQTCDMSAPWVKGLVSAKDYRPDSKIASEPMGVGALQSKHRFRLRGGRNQKRFLTVLTAFGRPAAPFRCLGVHGGCARCTHATCRRRGFRAPAG